MPYFVASLALQLLCVVHVMRSGRPRLWIYVIALFSVAGCLAYVVTELVPEAIGTRRLRRLEHGVRRAIDPARDYRTALAQVEISPTPHNRRVLADASMEMGLHQDAIRLYRSVLVGHDAHDPDLMSRLTAAQFAAGEVAGALATLDDLRAHNPEYRSASSHLLYARALEGIGRETEALAEYEAVARYFSGEEARCRHALLLAKLGKRPQAEEIFAAMLRSLKHAPPHYAEDQREWFAIARRHAAA